MEKGFGNGLKGLVVDDEILIQKLLGTILRNEGFQVETAGSVSDALSLWSRTKFDIALVDKNLPDGSGLDIIEKIHKDSEECVTLIMSAFANLDSAIEAMRLRTADYLVKPFDHPEKVKERIWSATKYLRLKRKNIELVEELRTKNRQLVKLATRDPLTGLFNHAYFQDQLSREISRSKRYSHPLGLIFIDVDRFKNINDSMGHQVGDNILKTISEILRGKSREVDYSFRLREHDIAARYGGDEFVVVLPETPKGGTATSAERLRACVEQHDFGPDLPQVTLSIGFSSYPEDGARREEIISAADIALYAAKNGGRNRVVAYEPDLAEISSKTGGSEIGVKRINALNQSISNREFEFVYQPIVYSETLETFGYEALCRPTNEMFKNSTQLFLTAEHAGRIKELGRVLREMATATIGELPEGCVMFVNLHPQELNDRALTDLEPFMERCVGKVVFEVTGSRNITDHERLRSTLIKLRDLGFKIALDDLHSGYLGLNFLARVEPEFVKLDISTIRGIHTDKRAYRMVSHFVEYNVEEDILVIAKGIESEEDRKLAIDLGCPLLMQGYHFAREEPDFVRIQS